MSEPIAPGENGAAAPTGGLTADDLPQMRRETVRDALTAGRACFDPAAEWDAFVEAVADELELAFGFVEREPWPGGLEQPDLGRLKAPEAQEDRAAP